MKLNSAAQQAFLKREHRWTHGCSCEHVEDHRTRCWKRRLRYCRHNAGNGKGLQAITSAFTDIEDPQLLCLMETRLERTNPRQTFIVNHYKENVTKSQWVPWMGSAVHLRYMAPFKNLTVIGLILVFGLLFSFSLPCFWGVVICINDINTIFIWHYTH